MKLRRKLISEESLRTKKSTIRFTLGIIILILISHPLFLTTCKESTEPEEPEEITGWQKHPDNPVLGPGPAGSWDDAYVGCPSVIIDNDTLYMFYVGGDGQNLRIGVATSANGISWEKYPHNPILDLGSEGTWDDYWVIFPHVRHGWGIEMWYQGNDGTTDRIGLAKSILLNTFTWEKSSENPFLEPGPEGSWDDMQVSTPFVYLWESPGWVKTFRLYYAGSDGDYFRIGYAEAGNDYTWEKFENNPVLDVGSWDSPRVQDPRIIEIGDTYHMWYSGGDFFTWRIGHATSADGISWTKDPNNPVLNVGKSGEWDEAYVGGCSVLFEETFKMWYTGGRGYMHGSIGYAIKK